METLNKQEVEQRLKDLIAKYKLGDVLTVEKIKSFIFDEQGQPGTSNKLFLKKLLSYFPDISQEEYIFVFQVAIDAWNIFPHSSLGGKSPEEMVEQMLKENPQPKQKGPVEMPKVIVGGRKMSWQEHQAMLKQMQEAQKPFKNFIEKQALPDYLSFFEQKTDLTKEAKEKYIMVAEKFFDRVLWVGFVSWQSIRPDFAKKEFPRWWQTNVMMSNLDENQVWLALRHLVDFVKNKYGLEMGTASVGFDQLDEPRTEQEMAGMFEYLLFLRLPNYSIAEEAERKKFSFTDNDIAFFDKEGLLNRIFRRWLQTTWGDGQFFDEFGGETPLQELGRANLDLLCGKACLSVKAQKDKQGKTKIQLLRFEGNVFEQGLANLARTTEDVVAPIFDKEFRAFVKSIILLGKDGHFNFSFQNIFSTCLFAFWQLAATNIVANSGLKFSQNDFAKVVQEVKNYLISFCTMQEKELGVYLCVANLFHGLWLILQKYDKGLPDLQKIIQNSKENLFKNKSLKQASNVFYFLGIAFDRYFLFPLERYFGSAEIVWTDQQLFLKDYTTVVSVLRNKALQDKLKGVRIGLGSEDTTFDFLRDLWFCPPSYFRLFGRVFRYLKSV